MGAYFIDCPRRLSIRETDWVSIGVRNRTGQVNVVSQQMWEGDHRPEIASYSLSDSQTTCFKERKLHVCFNFACPASPASQRKWSPYLSSSSTFPSNSAHRHYAGRFSCACYRNESRCRKPHIVKQNIPSRPRPRTPPPPPPSLPPTHLTRAHSACGSIMIIAAWTSRNLSCTASSPAVRAPSLD